MWAFIPLGLFRLLQQAQEFPSWISLAKNYVGLMLSVQSQSLN